MSPGLLNIEWAVQDWAARGCHRSQSELAVVIVAVESAWREGIPTEQALSYAKRRIAHYRAS